MDRRMKYLMFEDWIAQQKTGRRDWTVVAERHSTNPVHGPLTMSALLPSRQDQLDALFASTGWGFSLESLGKPGFNIEDGGPVYYSDSGSIGKLKFRGFTIHRLCRPGHDTHFELLQEFLLYHDAVYEPADAEWMGRDDDASYGTVGQRYSEDGVDGIRVDTHALRDFLAATGCVLVRCHSHTRTADATGLPLGDDDKERRRTIRDSERYYEIIVASTCCQDARVDGTLMGFDLVRPYDELPLKRRWWDRERHQYAEFIVDRDGLGHEVLSTCDPDIVGARRPGDDAHALTSVCFDVTVLDRYRNEPERFRHADGIVSQEGAWLIKYDINPAGLVQVWLKDLGYIPYREQLHWRASNVVPRGGISEARWRNDFQAEFLEEPPGLADRMWIAYHEANAATEAAWGCRAFRELPAADAHTRDSIASPIPDRKLDLDRQLGALAKLLCDSINAEGLETATGLRIDRQKGPIWGPIQLLDAALRGSGVPDPDAEAIIGPLKALQDLRSTGAAHARGANWDKARAKAGIVGMRPRKAWDKVLSDVLAALRKLGTHARPLKATAEAAGG